MADDRTPPPDDDAPPPPAAGVPEPPAEPPAPPEPAEETPEPAAAEPEPAAAEPEPAAAAPEPAAAAPEPAAAEPAAAAPAERDAPEIVDPNVIVTAADDVPGAEVVVEAEEEAPGVLAAEEVDEVEGDVVERVRPEIPGADLEVDIVGEGEDPFDDEDEEGGEGGSDADADEIADQPIAQVTIDLGADARYRATGKRKTAVARVTLRPGTGAYAVNGRTLEDVFPRMPLQRTIRQPLETVGYETRMDVVARLHGGGVSAQAGALRHGISRALLEADPNLRGELKRRGFLTRDPRVKERKKAGLKKARKRPQFSKR
jgi:small subunit ribosomal protein S9